MTRTVRQRFAFTLASSLLRSLFSFSTSMLLARWLGPRSFGSLAFLLGTFLALRPLLELCASTAFFTFMSQQPCSRRFVQSYYRWLATQFLVAFATLAVLLPSDWITAIWRGESRGIVLLAFITSFMQDNLWGVLQQAAESQRQTLKVQAIGVGMMATHMLAVVSLHYFGRLSVASVFILLASEYAVAAVTAHVSCVAPFVGSTAAGDSDRSTPGLGAYVRYCTPLVPYALVTVAYGFADRWLLQRFGGSIQQAFYSVGAQFANVALLATSSILQIFWKEIAEAYHRGNRLRTHMLYDRVSRMMFFISAAVACFFVPWSHELLRLLLGPSYEGGATTLMIMFLYPVHQSLGQVSGTMLYATETTRPQVLVGVAFMLLSMVVTYFVLAGPNSPLPGLDLGSRGLALKMVGLQMVQVNVLGYVIARRFGWRFEWAYQPALLCGCLGLALLAHAIAGVCGENRLPLPALTGLAGAIYLALVAGLVFALPGLLGLTRVDLVPEARTFLRQTLGVLRLRGS